MRIGFALPNPYLAFWAIIGHAIKERSDELGDTLAILTTSNVADQVRIVDHFVDQRVDALIVGPVESHGLAPSVQRATAAQSIGRFFRDIVFFIPSLFGAEINYSDGELTEYLAGIDKKDKIEGGYYSDNKARQIVKRWKGGNKAFDPTTRQKKLLAMEMLDGIVTDGDRQGVLDVLADSASIDTNLGLLFGPGKISFREVREAFKKEPYASRFNTFFIPWFLGQKFSAADKLFAEKILHDIFAVPGTQLDFADLEELQGEVVKRMRTSQLLQESQVHGPSGESGFDYPESVKDTDGCADFAGTYNIRNARVNLAARTFWTAPTFDPKNFYYFTLSTAGKENAFDALTSLFTPQRSICDKTLIHCDYLVNVVDFRVLAES